MARTECVEGHEGGDELRRGCGIARNAYVELIKRLLGVDLLLPLSFDRVTGAVDFDVLYDGQLVPVSVAAGTFGTSEALRAHIQTAVDTALVTAGAGTAEDVAVQGGLGETATAEAAIAAARTDNDLAGPTSFSFVLDGSTVSPTAEAFVSAEALRAHVQAAVDEAVEDARVADAGDIGVSLGAGDALVIELGHPLDDTSGAESCMWAASS